MQGRQVAREKPDDECTAADWPVGLASEASGPAAETGGMSTSGASAGAPAEVGAPSVSRGQCVLLVRKFVRRHVG